GPGPRRLGQQRQGDARLVDPVAAAGPQPHQAGQSRCGRHRHPRATLHLLDRRAQLRDRRRPGAGTCRERSDCHPPIIKQMFEDVNPGCAGPTTRIRRQRRESGAGVREVDAGVGFWSVDWETGWMPFDDELDPGGVTVHQYDPGWPTEAEALARSLQTLVPAARAVEHIGSTAIPGMAAKDCLDMMLIVDD